MKKILIGLFALLGISAMASIPELPFIAQGFPSTFGGIIYSEATRAAYMQQPVDLSKYTILGRVKVHAEMENVLLLVNWGDTSMAKLRKQAKQLYPQADDFVNIEIDVTHKNIVVFYMRTVAEMRAIAVKYKR